MAKTTNDLDALLLRYLEARRKYDEADRSVPVRDEDEVWEERCLGPSDRFDEAESDLRAAVLRRLKMDPRYGVPRPVAATIGEHVVMVVPDRNDSLYPESDGRLPRFGWRKTDYTDVASPDDVVREAEPAEAPARPKRRRKAAPKGGAR